MKDVIQYPRFTKLIIAYLMKKFDSISSSLKEDYHSIKDYILLVRVYTTGNVTVREKLISNAFLTDEIRATDDFKEYETVIIGVDVPMNQPQPVVSTQGMHMISPRAHKTPTLTAASPQEKKRKQSVGEISSPMKSLKVEIEKMVKGEEDEESYANDDDVNVTEKKNDGKHNEDVEETDDATGNMETRNERIQPPIPTPNRSPRKDLSSDKTISKELIATVSPTTATTSKSKRKRGFTSIKTKILPGSIVGMCRRRGQIRTHIKKNWYS
ncbi:hypothetical protein Tco_1444241 [Tanacetum coccineum]